MDAARRTFWQGAFPVMKAIWPWFERTVLNTQVWDDALSDLSVEQLIRGASYVIRNHSGNQPPTPGEIRDAALGPLTKCAVTRADGRVTRWELKRLKPPEVVPLRTLTGESLKLPSGA